MNEPAQRDDPPAQAKPLPTRALDWVTVLGPPLLMIPLAWLPWDMATSPFWFAGGVAWAIAMVRAVKLGGRAARGLPIDAPQLVRCVAAAVLFAAAFAALQHSLARADGAARAAATEALARCNTDRRCPEAVAALGGATLRSVGFTSTYEVHYNGGGESFSVAVLHNIDETLVISGGVGQKQLTEKLVGDGREE